MPAVRPLDPAADDALARTLLGLQRAAYAVEAALIGDDRIPPLTETLDELVRAPLTWAGALLDGRLAGAVAWTADGEVPDGLVDIDRLVVDPTLHRRGLGAALVRHVLGVAGGRPVAVSTGRDNAPARALYERLGFAHTGDAEVLPRLWVSRYRSTGPRFRGPWTGTPGFAGAGGR